MSAIEAISNVGDEPYRLLKPQSQRAIAVGAALELIQSRVGTLPTGTSLENELSKLSQYADKIQAALAKTE